MRKHKYTSSDCCDSPKAVAITVHRQAMHIVLFMLLFLAAFLFGARFALAEEPQKDQGNGTLMILIENDKFGGGTDQHYSNGVSATWVSEDMDTWHEDRRLPDWLASYGDIAPMLRGGDRMRSVALSVGHTIYTPIDTATEEFQKDDRPYAGWLFASMGLHSKTEEVLDVFETTIGVVGPSALGKQVQNNFHNLIGVYRAEGWEHQLKDEPGLMLTWQRSWRMLTERACDDSDKSWGFDFIPHAGMTVGNVMTYANVGGELRAGWNLPDNFGSSRIGPASGVSAPSADPEDHGFGTHVFAGTDVRAVARNIFLDGNTWQDSHSVAKKWLVGDIYAGASIHWDEYALTYTQAARSAEFYGQEEHHVFGSLMLTVGF